MAEKSLTKKKLTVEDVVIEVDFDSFTWGDLEDLESGSSVKAREVIQKFAKVDGVTDISEFLRGLSINQMTEISNQFQAALSAAQNPVSKNGKN